MRAGQLRHRVVIQSKSVSQNGFGEEVVTWVEVVTVWASVEPVRGRELIEAGQDVAERMTRIRMRYQQVLPEWRVVWLDRAGVTRVYDVLSVVNPAERGILTELQVREVVG